MSNVKKYRDLIEKHWDDIGMCGSCSWHASFWEHDVYDEDIQQALREGGDMELVCENKDLDVDEAISHRGVRFNLHQLAPTTKQDTETEES